MEKSSVLCQSRGELRLPPSPKVAPWLVFPNGEDGKFHTFYNLCADDQLNKSSSDLCQSRSDRRLPPPSKVAPWLVFPHGKDGKHQTFYNLCADDDSNKRSSKKFIPELSKRAFRQKDCHQGWLIVVCHDDTDPNYGDCYLWNPQTLDTVQLPSVLHVYKQDDRYWLKDSILTAPPQINTSISSNISDRKISSSSSNDYDKDFMVYLLFDGGQDGLVCPDTLLFCHPGEKEWRRQELNVRQIPNAIFYLENKLLVMCAFNPVYFEIEVKGGSDVADEETLAVGDAIFINTDSISVGGSTGGRMLYTYVEYFLESFGEVFRIRKWHITRGAYTNCVRKIQILKLNFASIAWEHVESLDDRVFFISNRTQLSCLASDLGLSKGCVYYTQEEETSLYRYDLEDQSISVSLPCPDLPTPWFLPEWMMITTTPSERQKTTCILGLVDHKDNVIKIAANSMVTANTKVTGNITRVTLDDEKGDTNEAIQGILARDDLVWSVSNHLHKLDYIHLRAVSKRYRAIMNLKKTCSARRTIQTTDLSPWLVYSNYARSIFSFVNPLHNDEKYLMNVSEMLKGFRICFSKGGWLLMSKGLQLFFHNPFTRSSIKLPDFPDVHVGTFSGISFSSLPTSADCTVFGFDKQTDANVSIVSIKRGEDQWRCGSFGGTYLAPSKKLMEFETGLNNPVFYNGAFYCLDLNGTLGVSKQENGNISWEVLAMVPRPNCEFAYESYLVECEGKLMCVLLGHLGKWVRIFRLNNTKMIWVEVENLGRHMLCISNTSCISAVAPNRKMENNIYFSRLHEEGVLFYSLDSGMYHCLGSRHSAKDYRDSKEMLYCSWIEPNWSRSSDQSLDWLSLEML